MFFKQKSNRFKKVSTVFLAGLITFSAIPIAALLSAQASDEFKWSIPQKESLITTGSEVVQPGLSIADITTEEGIELVWTSAGSYQFNGMRKTFPLDKMALKLNNFKRYDATSGKLAILLSSKGESELQYIPSEKENAFVILLDSVKGELVTYPNQKKLLQDNSLLYDNLKEKEIKLEFNKTSENSFDLSVTTGNSKSLNCNIKETEFNSATSLYDFDYVYAALGSWGENNMSVELNGIGPEQKSVIDSKLRKQTATNGILTKWMNNGPATWWPNTFAMTDLTSGGVKYEWIGAGTDVREGYDGRLALNGLKYQFNNLQRPYGSESDGYFAVVLTNDSDGRYNASGKFGLAFVFEPQNSRLSAYPSGKTIIENEMLSYESLSGKPFNLSVEKDRLGRYIVSVKVGSAKEVTGVLTKEMLSAATNLANPDSCRAMLSAWNGAPANKIQYTSVEYLASGVVSTKQYDDIVWSIPNKNDAILTEAKTTNWWGNKISLTDLPSEGGTRFSWTNAGTNNREGFKKTFNLDGMKLLFDNFEQGNAQSGAFAILLGSRAEYGMEYANNKTLALVLDTLTGKLTANTDSGISQEIISSDLLKYAAITGKQFELSLKLNNENYEVNLEYDSVKLTGNLPVSTVKSVSGIFDPEHCFAMLSAWGNNQTISIDWLATGPVFQWEKDSAKTVPSTSDIYNVINNWPTKISLSPASAGGLKFNFTTASNDIREALKTKFSMDNLVIQLNDLSRPIDNSSGTFALMFGNEATAPSWGWTADHPFMLQIDVGNGRLKAYPKDETVIQSEYLKYEYLAGKPLELRLMKNSDGSYTAAIKIGSMEPIKGVISKAAIETCTKLTNPASCNVSLSAWNSNVTFSLEYNGIKNYSLSGAETAIASIGTVTLENASALHDARAVVDKLTKSDQYWISNIDVLEDAEKMYAQLVEIADEELINLTLSDALYRGNTDNANVKKTLSDWASNLTVNSINPSGLRFKYTNAVTNIREGYKNLINLDGLELQFDNFRRTQADKGDFAVFFGNTPTYGPQYVDNAPALALVFDTTAGELKAYPGGKTVIKSDELLYQNFRGRRFNLKLNEDLNEDFIVTLEVNGKTLEGKITEDMVLAAKDLKDPYSCYTVISPWGTAQSFDVDFVGLKSEVTLTKVIELIDDIGIVTLESENALNAAETAYRTLSQKVQEKVVNFEALANAQTYFLTLDFDTMIEETISAIEEIGEVSLQSGKLINNAEDKWKRLTQSQQEKVPNSAKYFSDTEKYYKLIEPYLTMERYMYGPGVYNYFQFSEENVSAWWKDKLTFQKQEDGSLEMVWKDAVRNVRNGLYTQFNLDGLYMQLEKIKADSGSSGTKLAIFISSSLTDYDTNKYSLALVLDTEAGEVLAYPGGNVIIKNDELKQANLKDKLVGIGFNKTKEGLFEVTVNTGSNALKGVIPPSSMGYANQLLDTDKCRVVISPWVNNESGTTDNSAHSFSVNFVSIQDSGVFVFEQLYAAIDAINALPTEIKNDDDAQKVIAANKLYLSLPKMLRSYVTNYDKLAKMVDQLLELGYEDIIQPEIEEDENPETGDDIKYVLLLAPSVLAVAVLFRKRRKKSNKTL